MSEQNATTETVGYKFSVKEGVGGVTWIALEPRNGNLTILKNGFLGFDLPAKYHVRESQRNRRLSK